MENLADLVNEIDTILFVDETKFSVNNGDLEDAIFYFGIATNIYSINSLKIELTETLLKFNFQGEVFHSTKIFKEKNPREDLMNALVEIFLKYNLHCFCYKYLKNELFSSTKILNSFNNDIINFNNQEFQALFYFLIFLNTNLRDNPDLHFGEKYIICFDRNVYGRTDTENFNFPDDRFVIKHMTFIDKSKMNLLAFPDFFGYLFRKAKIGMDKKTIKQENFELSKLTQLCHSNLVKLANAKLFHFMNIEEESKILQQMFKFKTENI